MARKIDLVITKNIYTLQDCFQLPTIFRDPSAASHRDKCAEKSRPPVDKWVHGRQSSCCESLGRLWIHRKNIYVEYSLKNDLMTILGSSEVTRVVLRRFHDTDQPSGKYSDIDLFKTGNLHCWTQFSSKRQTQGYFTGKSGLGIIVYTFVRFRDIINKQ